MRLGTEFAQLDTLRGDVAELQRSIPAEANLDDFIEELDGLEAANGVTISSYTSSDPTVFLPTDDAIASLPASITSSNFLTLSIKMTIAGPRDKSMDFVEGLQKSGRLFQVSDLSVTREDLIDVSGLVYVLLDTPIAADPAAPTESSNIE